VFTLTLNLCDLYSGNILVCIPLLGIVNGGGKMREKIELFSGSSLSLFLSAVRLLLKNYPFTVE
jgi:hypothetical protein